MGDGVKMGRRGDMEYGVIVRASKEADIICMDEGHVGVKQRQAIRDFASANQFTPSFASPNAQDSEQLEFHHLRAHDHEKYEDANENNRAGPLVCVTNRYAAQWRIKLSFVGE